ncbi:alpha/beta fold hydrolase [Cupriavidus numazuensis]|uniref:4,5:9,10-diseco-3-hydroxy-5,9, 17-trioxoandrosta-1(10),2-diene-4-oate hydrolase n=1 Tax=Cupriavidus numazuensis TaxID=221992 RepID=A0ABM8TWT3_9BURK|nr:alpha/beta hydrolase [Cupriavidus numazuensis]CAG2161306.1 4,5:9,10-diseco-3-hydroxy-5,9, 17-trioxoandrosta-1(10),2-diene-4-oate hydrolase [Cupriavidus numazuensis]
MSLWLDFLGAEIRYVKTSFGSIRIAEAGKGNAEALFLMHGIGGHIEAYAKNVVPLADTFHVIALDFIGHGLSEKRDDVEYTPITYARLLAELMDVMDIQSAHLSGESLGGWVAGVFAALYPNRVKRLVLNTAAGIPVVSEKGRQDLRNLDELNKKNFGKPPSVETIRMRMQWLMHESNWHLLDDELIGSRLALYTRPDFQRTAPLVFALVKRHDELGESGAMIQPQDLQCETLYLWTRDNPIHDVAAATAACERTPKGKLYVMHADAAHWPQYEAPDEFNAVMRKFLTTGDC